MEKKKNQCELITNVRFLNLFLGIGWSIRVFFFLVKYCFLFSISNMPMIWLTENQRRQLLLAWKFSWNTTSFLLTKTFVRQSISWISQKEYYYVSKQKSYVCLLLTCYNTCSKLSHLDMQLKVWCRSWHGNKHKLLLHLIHQSRHHSQPQYTHRRHQPPRAAAQASEVWCGKGTLTRELGQEGPRCLSAYSVAVKPLGISEHRYYAYSPASKCSPNECPFATWMQWLHPPKGNGATSAPDVSSELHHICETNLQKKKREHGKDRKTVTTELVSSEIVILLSYNASSKPKGFKQGTAGTTVFARFILSSADPFHNCDTISFRKAQCNTQCILQKVRSTSKEA